MSFNMQKTIDKLRGKSSSPTFNHKLYGKIYYPYYNKSALMCDTEPEIYTSDGIRKRTFFIRDVIIANGCYSRAKYFEWDRYNFNLPYHFYSHNSMLETMGQPKKKFGLFIESESIVPGDYTIFKKHKGLEKDFDLIFTYSAEFLDKFENAKFVPFCAAPWNYQYNDSEAYKKKTKKVSILSSNKVMCDLHKFRVETAFKCKNEHLADTFGTFDGGNFININSTLKDYRYSICIENDTSPYFFTEKITSAFMSQTIPIYLGASRIDEIFNPEGIIKITTKSDIKEVIKQCSEEEYQRRLPAVLDNYQRVQKFINPYDYMYQTYLKDIL